MSIALGVDTGGTYTDAVLIRDEKHVLASAKSLTTRGDLAIGIGSAVQAVLAESGVTPAEIGMAALSTTLATNALVEGQGGRVGLVLIGFLENDLDAHGLTQALGGDPALVIAGGHGHDGAQIAPLDENTLRDWAAEQQVSGFAVAAQFATRNPEHEVRAAEILRAQTGCPVTASHQLSAKLGGPKRALTALLNARLIGLTHRLILRAGDILKDIGVNAPLMVVRGDGALMSAQQAQVAPIETILSGPAASLVGARWLTGADEALVSDIGGTTTDIALLRHGRPAIDPQGARVGPWRTMVEAVAMRTHGLGGDSEVRPRSEGLEGGVRLGPRRLVPIALIASEAPDVVRSALDTQTRAPLPGEYDGRFVRAVPGQDTAGLNSRDTALLERIGDHVQPLGAVLRMRIDVQALERLVGRGLVQVAGVTPTDAAHVLGRVNTWNAEASEMALALMARRRMGNGERLAADAAGLAQIIVDEMTRSTGLALLESAFAEEDWEDAPADLARHALMQSGLRGHQGLVAVQTKLAVPVIGLGASAGCYYPAVADSLNATVELPEFAGVANAIGAVVGRVAMRRQGVVTAPSEGRYRVHLADGPQDFGDAELAISALEHALETDARAAAEAAGATDVTVRLARDIRQAETEGRQVFIEATVLAEASGRPRITGDI
ncbi:hydantoinase/oxoprolinase family protein [Thalassococcus lentus]|uniref:Hydantoinase/oxoprolinase family protein n=1 Tax=Thalassococcus lentus TaxID=1210524 RepID=A0ABT4XNZ6_9RHOB|nr:hydantoinase/oxoprolinase family protein [Thalassococcus lentus]MDA7423671.1 hydantoinase/oxoprolinase family protein [Thalassococcus lentus]